MNSEQITANFDAMAEGYDRQWGDNAPMNECLHLLMGAVLRDMPQDARILCVGAGTGAEILYLAKKFTGWTFTAVDPSYRMLAVCRKKFRELGLESRCSFHVGYVNSLPPSGSYDAATAIFVSQFINDKELRKQFFRELADQLKHQGVLISADLSSDVNTDEFDNLLYPWTKLMAGEKFSVEKVNAMRHTYTNEISVLPPHTVTALIQAGGFDNIVQFFQAALMHGWYAVKK